MSRWALLPVVAVVTLVWLGAPAWPQQLDDQLITLAFAHEWAAHGLPRWGTGSVVEACSSFLQLALAAGWIAIGGGDANLFVKVLGALAGLALVAFAALRVPRHAAGVLVLAALVTWEPLAWWTFAGMETTLSALLLTVGWVGVLHGGSDRGRLAVGPVAGLGALWLAATAHPEGNLHFALGAAILGVRGDARARRAVVVYALALAGWHALRVAYFGHLLPTPYLVKMAGNDPLGDQWGQWGLELVTLAGLGAVCLVAFPARPLALLPLLVQCALELRAEPDWMGHARHLVPGVCATVVAWTTDATPRPLGRRPILALLAVIGLAGLLEPPGVTHGGLEPRDARSLVSPARWFGAALDTTQLEDVVWIVESAPWNGSVLLEDVGMTGNIAGVDIVDLVGLTDREIALAWLGDEAVEARLRRRFALAPPSLVRRMRYGNDQWARDVPWMELPVPERATYPQGTALRYRLDPARPTDEQVAARWAALYARYPSQGPVAWHHALSEARQGRLVAAARIAATATRRFPTDPTLAALPASLFAPFELDTFADLPSATRQVSRPLPRAEAAGLALTVAVQPVSDEGQLVHVRWSCDAPEMTVVVHDTTTVPLPGWACAGADARLLVEALDDRPRRPLPREIYVGLTAR
ncbi:MAG: hypothetical protein Q8P41_20825 [Pseudomonadota bacterium]|nr:hypothetical protein [Pseudomonadota bacterium]